MSKGIFFGREKSTYKFEVLLLFKLTFSIFSSFFVFLFVNPFLLVYALHFLFYFIIKDSLWDFVILANFFEFFFYGVFLITFLFFLQIFTLDLAFLEFSSLLGSCNSIFWMENFFYLLGFYLWLLKFKINLYNPFFPFLDFKHIFDDFYFPNFLFWFRYISYSIL